MKRFLSLFAIMALIVSMFSGVGFAAPVANTTYTIQLSNNGFVASGTKSYDINVTFAANGTHLNDEQVEIVGQSIYSTIEAGTATFTGEQLSGLAAGTYTINIKGALDSSGTAYLEVDGTDGYIAANDATVVTATLTVVDASVDNITAGDLKSAVEGSIKAHADIVADKVTLQIKDSQGVYQDLAEGCLELPTADTDLDGDTTTVVIPAGATEAQALQNISIDTVEILQAAFTDSDSDIGLTNVWKHFSNTNTTGTIDLRLVITNGTIDSDGVNNDTVYIDFTYSATPLTIELNDDMFYFDENGGNITISGKILNKNTESPYDYDDDDIVALGDDGDNVFDETFSSVEGQVDVVNNGQFDITFNAYNENNGIQRFWVYTEDNTPTRGDYFFTTYTDTFVLTPEFEIDSDLEFDFPFSGTVEIDGVFVNDDNSFATPIAKADIIIAYLDATNEYEPADTGFASVLANDKVFGFLSDGSYLTKTGDIGLFFKGVRVATGEVSPGELSLEISPDEVPNNLENQEISFTFDIGSDYYTEDAVALENNYRLVLKIEDEDGNSKTITSATTVFDDDGDDVDDYVTVGTGDLTGYVTIVDDTTPGDHEFTSPSSQKVTVSLPVDGWEKGTYTAYVKLYDVDTPTVIQETSVEFEVEKPAAYNLIGWGLDDTKVGTTTFSFDKDADVAQTVVVKNDDGDEELYLEVVFNGCGLEDKTFATQGYDDDVTEDDFEISVSETGTLEVKINVYTDENDETPDKTFTEEIKVTGWNVEVTPSEIVVGSEDDVVFTVTDEDGNPINNAIITVNDVKVVDGTTSSIIGGVYTYEYDEDTFEFDTVGEFDVKFYKGAFDAGALEDDLEVTLEGGLEVIGEEVYTVEVVENSVMLNGLEEDIKVSVLDAEGDIVYPTFYRIDVDSDGDESSAVEINGSALGSYTDVDGVAGKEARTITMTPDASQQAIIIRATTDDGAKMGEVRIEVQKPQLVMEDGQKLTENFTTGLEFTVIDPRDNSVLENDVYLKADDTIIDYSVDDAEGDDVTITDGQTEAMLFDDSYKFDVYVDDVNWEKAEDEEKDVEVELYIDLDEDVNIVDFAIEKATLTSTPESVIIGAGTNIVLTYTDANGVALEDYDVTLDDEEVGTTDENGQVVYSASSTSSVSLTFEVDTDDSDADNSDVDDDDDADTTTNSVKVKSAADTQAPVATFEVNGKSAIITITDNVRLLKSFVNKQEVNMYFPMPNATHIVEGLKAGDNEVHVLSSDTKGNILDTILVITVEATIEPVTFTIGVETEFGAPALVEETTMVPVRFAEQLGAVVGWDNETQTVTYTLGDTVISMTVGSKTAVVNGENTQLTVAPYKNELGRTMVPLRMIAQDLGFTVEWTSNDAPITIK